jgi:NAD(P)-dependent dehydrogenase (short-subunit alcohol dehydrogenase family)
MSQLRGERSPTPAVPRLRSEFDSRVAIITGGGQGIGRLLAVRLAELGATVGVVARTRADIEQTALAVGEAGGHAEAFQADVSRPGEVSSAVQRMVEIHGRLDVLIAAAGVYGPIGPVLDVDLAAWEETIRINLLGTLYSIQAVLPPMMAQRSGKIIAFSGGGGASPRPRFSAYAASKAAVVRLVESVAAEVAGYGIDVNTVAPGPVPTRLHAEVIRQAEKAGEAEVCKAREIMDGGPGSVERVVGLVRFLASRKSDGLTGRLISAVWDDWETFADRLDEIRGSELYTMRRIIR